MYMILFPDEFAIRFKNSNRIEHVSDTDAENPINAFFDKLPITVSALEYVLVNNYR